MDRTAGILGATERGGSVQLLPWIGAALCMATLFATAVAAPPAEKKAEAKDVAALLRHEIVGQTLPLAEIQCFCEKRVPRLASYKSAAEWEAAAGRLRQQVLEKVVFRGQAAAWRSHAATHPVDGDHSGRARLSHQEAPLRGPAGHVYPGPLVRTGNARRSGACHHERQRTRRHTGQGRALQTDSLHQSSQTRHARLERRVDRHGPTRRPRLPARVHEPTRSVRHQRPGALLSGDATRPRRALEPRPRRFQAHRGRRTFRRRLANHLHQFSRFPGYAG